MTEADPASSPVAGSSSRNTLSRRGFLGSAAAVAGAVAVASVVGYEGLLPRPARAGSAAQTPAGSEDASTSPNALASPPRAESTDATGLVAFDGVHQAGIVTPAQDRLAFASFDVTSTSREELASLLRTWSDAARRMSAGVPVGDVGGAPLAPPVDTGEALGLPAARLTVTVGFGASLFDGRFGLAGRRPAALTDLPAFPGDALEDARSGGDLCIQACADDPVVAFHAVRDLARLARGVAVLRWFQLGFGRTSSTSSAQATPRNLMGFKDGTNNLVAEDTDAIDASVWVGADTDQPWMRGGSYLVTRRIRMRIESWDRTGLGEQERVFGREKVSGAALSQTVEHDPVPLDAVAADGQPVIAADAHIRLAAPATTGVSILRRGYSYTDGMDPVTGELDAGLFFICFQRDPRTQFVAIQRGLASHDALGEYIRHTGSALFACPPGTSPGESWGEALFEAS